MTKSPRRESDPTSDASTEAPPSFWRRLRRREQEEAAEKEASWDRRVARLWGAVLLAAYVVLPLSWRWRGSDVARDHANFLWDHLDGADTTEVLGLILPPLYGLAALVGTTTRLRDRLGTILLLGGLAVLLVPLFASHVAFLGLREAGVTDPGLLWVLALLLAPPVVAGANRVVRRLKAVDGRRTIVGVAGVALLFALFLPFGPGGRSVVGSVFVGGHDTIESVDRLNETWPLMVWIALFVVYGGIAALFLVPRLAGASAGYLLSRLARGLLWSLPVLLVLADFEPEMQTVKRSILLVGGTLRLYGPLILLATGIALTLGPPRRRTRQQRRNRR